MEPSIFLQKNKDKSSLVNKSPDAYYYLNQNNNNINQILPPLKPPERNCNSNEKVHHPLKLYTLKEYKEIKKNFDFTKGIEKGGLGPSVKDEKWKERKKLVERMKKFSHDVKIINTSKIAKFFEESVAKENNSYQTKLNQSTRQKGWEFAKNIHLPKTRRIKDDIETILEKEDLEETLEYYEQKHRDFSKRLEKNKIRKE